MTAPTSTGAGLTGLAPVIAANTRILILGSFPGPPRSPRNNTMRIRARVGALNSFFKR